MTDHHLRVIQTVGQMLLILSFVFYAGVTYQRLNELERLFEKHQDVPWHGDIGVRMTAVESKLEFMTIAINRLVDKLDNYGQK